VASKEADPIQDSADAPADAPNTDSSDQPQVKEEEVEEATIAENDNGDDKETDDVVTDKTSNKRPHEDVDEKEASAPAAPPLRRGKWSAEEEAYASRLIVEFRAGLLPLTDGTTLRTFLSKLLNCDPMRISKKFVGSNCIGKQVFRRRSADVSNLTPEQIALTRRELSELEKRFLDRVTKGGSGKRSTKAERAEKKMKINQSKGMSALVAGIPPNSSAAAAGHALLGGTGGPNSTTVNDASLLAHMQANRNLFNNPAVGGGMGFNTAMGSGAAIGNLGRSTLDLNSIMLQTGMTPEQLTQLSQNKGLSSASLANMLGNQHSFDRLMSMDFQSIQSIDNLANLMKRGMPNQIGKMKNWDSGAPQAGMDTQAGYGTSLGNISSLLSLNGMCAPMPQGLGNQANAAFGNFNPNSLLQQSQHHSQMPQQGLNQLNQLRGFQPLSNSNGTDQNQMLSNLLQNMGGNTYESLLQNAQSGNNYQQNFRGFNQYGGLQAGGNPMQTQQMLNPPILPQQNQLSGVGGVGGRLGGLAGIDFSDPNTTALLRQLLAQQGGEGGQLSAGLPNQQAQSQGVAGPVAGADGNSQSSDQVGKSVDV